MTTKQRECDERHYATPAPVKNNFPSSQFFNGSLGTNALCHTARTQFDTETETSVTCRDAQRAQVATVRVRIEFKTKLRARSYNKMASRHTLGAFFSYRYESAYPRALSGGMRQRVGFVIRICNLLCLVDGRCNVSISLAPPAILGKTKDLGDDDSLPRTTIDAPDPMYASGIGVQVPLETLSMIPPGLSASIRASRQCPSLRARAA